MKKTFITQEQFKISPWKNGAGITAQIAIDPPEADFAKGDFNWRVSSAHIEGENQFSQFPGYDRLLTVLSGEGLLLNSEELGPFEIFRFPGEAQIECSLIGNPVEDLGVIYKRDHFNSTMQILNVTASLTLNVENGVHFFMPLSPEVQIEGVHLEPPDFLQIEDAREVEITSAEFPAHLLWISIISTGARSLSFRKV